MSGPGVHPTAAVDAPSPVGPNQIGWSASVSPVGESSDPAPGPDPADTALAAESVTVVLAPRCKANRFALRVCDGIGAAARGVAALLLAVIVVVVSLSVYSRYVQGRPLVWAEDLSLHAFVWMCFLGLVYLTQRQLLLSLPVLANRLSGRPRLVLAMCSGVITAYVCWVLFDWGRVVLVNVAGTRSAALGLPGWAMYAAAPAAGLTCLIIVAVQLSCLMEMAVRRAAR